VGNLQTLFGISNYPRIFATFFPIAVPDSEFTESDANIRPMSSTETSPAYGSRFKNIATAQKYADRFERPTHRHINRREQRAVTRILTELGGISSILDMPAGAGRFLLTLVEAKRTIYEMDISHEMISLGHERVVSHSIRSAVHFVQGSAFGLPLADGSIDCIFCNRLLHHFKDGNDRVKLLAELHRVARRYVIVSFFDYHRFGRLRVLLKKLRGRNPDYSGYPTREVFESELAAVGFKVDRIEPTGPVWVAQVYYLLEKGLGR
jgi:ubiquinone/menaquinone biosynthesis C-methylase UbiE